MQKKLMALAVAGALAVPAVAFAAGSSVQITGRLNYEYGRVDGGTNRPSTDMANNPGGSNIKFKGTESLGGGMSAWFQCETSADVRGIDQDGWCTRNSAVGLKGGFGNLHFGVWDTPFKRAMNAGDVGSEGTGILGMSFIAFGGSGGADATGGSSISPSRQRWKRRERGLTYYESPKFGGFQVLGAVSAGDRGTRATNGSLNQKPRVYSISGVYDNGPLEFGIGYEQHKDFGAYQTGATQDLDDDSWGLGVAYTFGKVQVGAFYHKDTYETGVNSAGVNGESKKKTYGIGVSWRLPGPHQLEAQYVKADDTEGNGGSIGGNGGFLGCDTAVSGVRSCGDTGADAWTLGYTYRFSKRTTVKLGYIRYDNDARTNSYRLGSSGSLARGDSQDGYAMLWKHNF